MRINILSDYIHAALEKADLQRLNDGTYCAQIPNLNGVVAFGKDFKDCRQELRATLEGWILLRLQLGQVLPVINGINLNRKPIHETTNSM